MPVLITESKFFNYFFMQKAEKSLRFYRGLKEDDETLENITYELGLLKNLSFKAAETNCQNKIKLKMFCEYPLKTFYI